MAWGVTSELESLPEISGQLGSGGAVVIRGLIDRRFSGFSIGIIFIELPRFDDVGVTVGFAEVGRSCFIGLNEKFVFCNNRLQLETVHSYLKRLTDCFRKS